MLRFCSACLGDFPSCWRYKIPQRLCFLCTSFRLCPQPLSPLSCPGLWWEVAHTHGLDGLQASIARDKPLASRLLLPNPTPMGRTEGWSLQTARKMSSGRKPWPWGGLLQPSSALGSTPSQLSKQRSPDGGLWTQPLQVLQELLEF